MEFRGRPIRRKGKIEVEVTYPSCLQYYAIPPLGNVSLNEFDDLAVERLKVLRTIERFNLSGQLKSTEEWMTKLYDDFSKNKYFVHIADKLSTTPEIESARRRDHMSHFILRLAYCRTEELRRWFVAHETDLFRARFLHATQYSDGVDVKLFLQENNLHFESISAEETKAERENLLAGTYSINSGEKLDRCPFFKVAFTDALELVRTRKVFVKGGFAFVPETDLVTLVSAAFRSHLSHELAVTSRALPNLEDDERLLRLLQDFDKRYTGSDYSSNCSKKGQSHLTPETIDKVATTSFPLCMRSLHDTLASTHHLKHNSRLQYGLFLKAAGMNLEDAMVFWRSHFTKAMDGDKFEKQYAYNIRHYYGKEGKRTDYTPYSCMKIIMSNVGPGEAHGCPFRHSDAAMLRQRLGSLKVPTQATNEIIELVGKSHYQIACQRYWEVTHTATLDAGINHPNQYLEESQAILNGISKGSHAHQVNGAKLQVKTTKAILYSSQSTQQSQVSETSQRSDINDDFDDDLDAVMLTQSEM